MKKDLILSSCVVLGAGAVVFGVGFLCLAHLMDSKTPTVETAHASAEPAKSAHGETHGESHSTEKPKAETHGKDTPKSEGHSAASHEKPAAEVKPPANTSPAILAEVEARFNDLLARNRFDECRDVANKALTYPGHNHAAWQLRLALATAQSDVLPKQQRHAKALELYTAALAQGLEAALKEQAHFGICTSLSQLARWEDLEQASSAYMKEFKQTLHTPQIQLFHALGVAALGRNADARAEFEALTGNDTPDPIRAQALWHIAQLNLKEAETHVGETVVIPAAKISTHEIPQAEATAPVVAHTEPLVAHDVLKTEAATKATVENNETGVPDAQWESIRRALQRGEFMEAQRMLEPYLESATRQQRASMSVKYASLMVQLSVDGGIGERKK